MDSDPNYLVSCYKETNRYFSYGGDNLVILPNLNGFISQYDNCLFAVPLPKLNDNDSLVESLLKDESLYDIYSIEATTKGILCILDSNEDNLYNGKKYTNKCVVALGGISRYLVNPQLDQLIVIFSNNVMGVYSILSDKQDWLYLSQTSSIKINNNNRGISSVCVSNNDVYIGLMEGTLLVYQNFKFHYSFKLNSSPITLLKPFKRDKLFVCSREGYVYFYDTEKRATLVYFKDHTTFVKSLHYIVTKDNEIGLITLDNDNIINLWLLTGGSVTPATNSRRKREDDFLVLVDKEQMARPFKRIIKNKNIVSISVITSKLSDYVERRKKGSWILLIIEESGKIYYEDPTDQSTILKSDIMYGFGLVKSMELSKELIVLLSLNGTILIYDYNFQLIKSLLSNFNNLFQFSLITTKNNRNKEDHKSDYEMDTVDEKDREQLGQSHKERFKEMDYYEYSKRWYNNHINRHTGSKLMIILIGDEVLRILLLNHINEFIPLGLKNNYHRHQDVITTIYHDNQNDLLLSGSKDKLIILWDVKTLIQLKLINTIYIVTSLLLVTTKLNNSNVVDIVCSNSNIINLYSTKLSRRDEANNSENRELGDVNKELDKSNYTSVIHKSNVNYLGLSHNQKYISSCSNDKTIVVHYTNNLIVKGRCIGHKKSVLFVKFMKLTKTLISSSMDQTIKIWNLSNFTNIKTFQGHTNSIMKLLVLESNVQFISCALDGFIKLWNIPNSDCVQTLNSHENQPVWDMELDNDLLFSASNNLIVVCKDASSELIKQKTLEDKEEEVVTSQINSLLLKDNYRESLILSIKLNSVKLTNNIIVKLTNKLLFEPGFKIEEDGCGEDVLDHVIKHIGELKEDDKKQLMRNLIHFIKIWITNKKNYYIGSVLLNKLLRKVSLDELMKVEGLLETIEFLLHNLSSHQSRLSNLQEKSYILDIIMQHNPIDINRNTINDVLYKHASRSSRRTTIYIKDHHILPLDTTIKGKIRNLRSTRLFNTCFTDCPFKAIDCVNLRKRKKTLLRNFSYDNFHNTL